MTDNSYQTDNLEIRAAYRYLPKQTCSTRWASWSHRGPSRPSQGTEPRHTLSPGSCRPFWRTTSGITCWTWQRVSPTQPKACGGGSPADRCPESLLTRFRDIIPAHLCSRDRLSAEEVHVLASESGRTVSGWDASEPLNNASETRLLDLPIGSRHCHAYRGERLKLAPSLHGRVCFDSSWGVAWVDSLAWVKMPSRPLIWILEDRVLGSFLLFAKSYGSLAAGYQQCLVCTGVLLRHSLN